jgi:peptide/nickel transport system permease protein
LQTVARLILKRLAVAVILLLIISVGVFGLLQLAPGSTERALLGNQQASAATIAAIRAQYHLDQPFVTQYRYWLTSALHGDFGSSVTTLQPVSSAVGERAGVSSFLIVYAFVITLLLGVGCGVLAARRPGGFVDRLVVSGSLAGISTPAFASAVLLLVGFSVRLQWFPAFGGGDTFVSHLEHLTLPAVALAVSSVGLVLKVTRAAMMQALGQDYVAFARARGLSGLRITFVYALRNASIQVVTSAGLILAYLITGDFLVEKVFSIAGVGSLLIDAVQEKDIAVVQGITLVVAATIIGVNLVTDLTYLAIDPRLRKGER